MWRAVSVNNEAKTTKLVTQWNISTSNYNKYSDSSFAGSYMEDWLNDTSVDGFLYNLRDYENFIVTNSVWDATLNDKDLGSIERPNGTSVVTDAVGLLNVYEYQASYDNSKSYLNNDIAEKTARECYPEIREFMYEILWDDLPEEIQKKLMNDEQP